jgi:hypothetical protein
MIRNIYVCMYIFYGATARRRPGPPHSWGLQILHYDTPQSVELLWAKDQPVAQTSTWKTLQSKETDIHATGGIRNRNPSKR